MAQQRVTADRAVHSDFLIHWTGKDIDAEDDFGWSEQDHRSKTSERATQRYLERLTNILRFGLWMIEDPTPTVLRLDAQQVVVPPTPQVCFTELKLSESRRHATRYGRLGIGVKRPFLFHRAGRPMLYYGFSNERNRDPFLQACASELADKRLLNYFKPMNEDERHLTYEYYAESEWRMLFFERLLLDRKVIDPRDSSNSAEYEYFQSLPPDQQRRLKYLVPLDGWLAMIIYPSLKTKNAVQWEEYARIREEIRRIKTANDHANRVEGLNGRGNWPIEVNLDACAHF